MTGTYWFRVRFLESIINLLPLVQKISGKIPSSHVARDIASCLQQGRQFYEAAQNAPLEIKPLLQFYGMSGFSKALILAKRCSSIATLKQSHGLRDVSVHPCRIADLSLRILAGGTFQEFNDAVRDHHRFRYNVGASAARTITFSTANSDQLQGIQLTLKDILGRIPYLEELYVDTFKVPAATVQIMLSFKGHRYGEPGNDNRFHLVINDEALFTDLRSLTDMLDRWRQRFPFLKKWRLLEAEHRHGGTVLTFENGTHATQDELVRSEFSTDGDKYINESATTFVPLADVLPPLANGFSGTFEFVTMPVGGQDIAEFSLHFLGLYLLSSLVRYRPSTWAHAVSRTGTSDAPTDDSALALIERFLAINSEVVPKLVTDALNPNGA